MQDRRLQVVRNFQIEERQCRLYVGEVLGDTVHAIRSELRDKKLQKRKDVHQRGMGVLWYDKCTLTDSWMLNKGGLLSDEWSNVIKASLNSMANRGTGERSVGGSRHCRPRICSENKNIETLPHIRGACLKTELLCNSAHHHRSVG